MKKNIKSTIEYYCKIELNDLMNDDRIKNIFKIAKENELVAKVNIGREKNKPESKPLYISLHIEDTHGDHIYIWDEGYLSASTKLIDIDKKNRVLFYSWEDTDFTEDLPWIEKEILQYNSKSKDK